MTLTCAEHIVDLARDGLLDNPPLAVDWSEWRKPVVGIVKPITPVVDPYWNKFAAYCEENQLPYRFYDAHASDWLEQGRQFDIIAWRVLHAYADDVESRDKIYILDQILHKTCFPTYHEIWHYNDKIRQSYLYEANRLPHIPTFVFYRQAEAEEFVRRSDYPLVWKLSSGAGATNVGLLRNRAEGVDFIRKAFPRQPEVGSRLPHYVYLQKFIAGAQHDLRVIVVGDYLIGYYRRVPKGDFRASGSGLIEKGAVPQTALELAWEVKKSMGGTVLAVDMIDDNGEYKIIETSTYCKIINPERQEIDGVPGRYVRRDGEFSFEPGRFWIQHLVMDELVSQWMAVHAANR